MIILFGQDWLYSDQIICPVTTVGLSSQNRLLIISHVERGDCIRIISARELTPRERRQYEEASSNG